MELYPRITAVEVQPGFRLRLWFKDGTAGIVDLASVIGTASGVLLPLRDPEFFAQVRVDAEWGTVVWPNGVDLDPDVLYAKAHGLAIAAIPPSLDPHRA